MMINSWNKQANRCGRTVGPAFFIVVFLILACSFPGSPVSASQPGGHVFFASQMLQGPVKTFVDSDSRSVELYLLGAVSPDSVWLAHLATSPALRSSLEKQYKVKLPKELYSIHSVIPDVHQELPVEACLSLLENARTQDERVFTLGWITHFIVDAHVHGLIARISGVPSDSLDLKDPKLLAHDRLEALEMRHIYSRYGNQMLVPYIDEEQSEGKSPYDFLRRSLGATYPGNSAFQAEGSKAFAKVFGGSEELILTSGHWFHYEATHQPDQIERTKHLIRFVYPQQGRMLDFLADLPSREEYEGGLKNEAFLAEWEKERTAALKDADELLSLCVLYFWRKDHRSEGSDALEQELVERIGAKLRAVAPSGDLMDPLAPAR